MRYKASEEWKSFNNYALVHHQTSATYATLKQLQSNKHVNTEDAHFDQYEKRKHVSDTPSTTAMDEEHEDFVDKEELVRVIMLKRIKNYHEKLQKLQQEQKERVQKLQVPKLPKKKKKKKAALPPLLNKKHQRFLVKQRIKLPTTSPAAFTNKQQHQEQTMSKPQTAFLTNLADDNTDTKMLLPDIKSPKSVAVQSETPLPTDPVSKVVTNACIKQSVFRRPQPMLADNATSKTTLVNQQHLQAIATGELKLRDMPVYVRPIVSFEPVQYTGQKLNLELMDDLTSMTHHYKKDMERPQQESTVQTASNPLCLKDDGNVEFSKFKWRSDDKFSVFMTGSYLKNAETKILPMFPKLYNAATPRKQQIPPSTSMTNYSITRQTSPVLRSKSQLSDHRATPKPEDVKLVQRAERRTMFDTVYTVNEFEMIELEAKKQPKLEQQQEKITKLLEHADSKRDLLQKRKTSHKNGSSVVAVIFETPSMRALSPDEKLSVNWIKLTPSIKFESGIASF